MTRETLQAWASPSSRGVTCYETIVYTDGSTSCDCPGWIYARKGGTRTCKHIRALEPEILDALERARRPRPRRTPVTPTPQAPREDWPSRREPARSERPTPATPPRRRIRLSDEET